MRQSQATKRQVDCTLLDILHIPAAFGSSCRRLARLVSFLHTATDTCCASSPNHRAFGVRHAVVHEAVDVGDGRERAGEEGKRHVEQRLAVDNHPAHHEAEALSTVLRMHKR